jgi:hypothetical protein
MFYYRPLLNIGFVTVFVYLSNKMLILKKNFDNDCDNNDNHHHYQNCSGFLTFVMSLVTD